MQNNGTVRGGKKSSKPLIVGKTTVYVHTDIHEVEVGEGDNKRIEYEYQETTYTKDEYIQMMAEQNQILSEQITQTQDALNYLIMNS